MQLPGSLHPRKGHLEAVDEAPPFLPPTFLLQTSALRLEEESKETLSQLRDNPGSLPYAIFT